MSSALGSGEPVVHLHIKLAHINEECDQTVFLIPAMHQNTTNSCWQASLTRTHTHAHTCCTQTPTACPGAPLPRRHCEALSLQVDEISIHRLQGLQRGTHALQQPYFTLRLRNSASHSARGSAALLFALACGSKRSWHSQAQFSLTILLDLLRTQPVPHSQSTVNLSPQD